MKYFVIFFFFSWFAVIIYPKIISKAEPNEFEQFCLTYMRWVNQYPNALSAGCCDYEHSSNDILKEEYKGEPLLVCYHG